MIIELKNDLIDFEKAYVFVRENEALLPDPLSLHVDIAAYCRKLFNKGRVFACVRDGCFVGIAMGYINDLEHRTGHLQILIVKQAYQSAGVGGALVDRFLEECKKIGMSKLELTCDSVNAKAHQFYQRHGFVDIAEPSLGKIRMSYRIE